MIAISRGALQQSPDQIIVDVIPTSHLKPCLTSMIRGELDFQVELTSWNKSCDLNAGTVIPFAPCAQALRVDRIMRATLRFQSAVLFPSHISVC
jgi:hypothetical protein